MRAEPVRDRRVDVIAIAGGALVFLWCALIASSGRVGSTERAVFEAINGLPPWLEPPATVIQFAGTLAVGPVVVVVGLVLHRWRLAIVAAVVTVAKLVAERIVWEFVIRERPGTTEPEAIVRGSVPTAGPSFVSGHVVLTTGLAWALTPYLPGRWKIAPWLVVALVSCARVYLGAHNPLDIVGGFALGVAIGAAVDLAARPGAAVDLRDP
jgi:membrane-associated phospholipid phosphatase